MDQFATHARGGVGIKAGVVSDKTGKAVDVRALESENDDLVIVSTQGQVIRQPLASISLIGRATQGVRIMRMKEGDKVASVAMISDTKLDEELADIEPADNAATESNTKPAAKPAAKKAKDV